MRRPAARPEHRVSHYILPWIQGLRALAALSVAFLHIAHDTITNGGDPTGLFQFLSGSMPWAAGVDIFFVISGFVIVYASAPLFGQKNGPKTFLSRRLTRIVPLYWLMTTAFLAILLISRREIHGDMGGPWYIIASYFFIPLARPDGLVQPAFGLGWTLNYEMFFYLVFTPFLLLARRPAVLAAGGLLGIFVLAGQLIGFGNLQLMFWSNPIILEFTAGMAIALCSTGNMQINAGIRLGLFLSGIVALHFTANAPIQFRALAWGLPAMAIVAAAALGGAPAAMTGPQKILIRLGDASYALYLVHPFVMRGFTVLWHKFHAVNEITGTIYVFSGLLTAQACALAINMAVERKLSALLKRRRSFVNEAF